MREATKTPPNTFQHSFFFHPIKNYLRLQSLGIVIISQYISLALTSVLTSLIPKGTVNKKN